VTRTTRRRPGPAIRRRRDAVWQKKNCTACGAPVRLAEERLDGGRLRGALIERDPVDGALLVRDKAGYLVRDYRHEMAGLRWAWHNCPVRNAADQVKP
jgi:hypothetical protein